ncbi:MAG: hypothetical protein AAFV88_11370 [Planctomycetota bacterium]
MTFTIFNCGTGYHRGKRDVVVRLYELTSSHKFINDGPGSRGNMVTNKPGQIAGVGVGTNVSRALRAIEEHYERYSRNRQLIVNLAGWSRGAITCLKIANRLYLKHNQLSRMVRFNIYGIDPVPGGGVTPGANVVNNPMWRKLKTTPNIKTCSLIYAQHDNTGMFRELFLPYVPQMRHSYTETEVEVMPGNHSEMVEQSERNPEAHNLVMNLAKKFLSERGTNFRDNTQLGDDDILDKYATIYDGYRRIGGKARERKMIGIKKKSKRTDFVLRPNKPPFFINWQHREVFTQRFPHVAQEIDRSTRGQHTQRAETRGALQQDFRRLNSPQYRRTHEIVHDYLIQDVI